MKRMTPWILLLLVCLFFAFAFQRGWLSVSQHSQIMGTKKSTVILTMDPEKAEADVEAAEKSAADLVRKRIEPAK